MNLKAIPLPAAVITSLYTNTLVEGEIATPITVPDRTEVVGENEFSYLGENEKKVLIIVNGRDAAYLPDDEMTFLINMLTACKLSIKDVAIFNIAGLADFSYRQVVKKLESRVVLLINTQVAAIGLPLDFPHFQVQPFSNLTFMSCPSLTEIKNDQLQKSKLWVCLRRIFNV